MHLECDFLASKSAFRFDLYNYNVLDLSALRHCLNAAERVNPDTSAFFAKAGRITPVESS